MFGLVWLRLWHCLDVYHFSDAFRGPTTVMFYSLGCVHCITESYILFIIACNVMNAYLCEDFKEKQFISFCLRLDTMCDMVK